MAIGFRHFPRFGSSRLRVIVKTVDPAARVASPIEPTQTIDLDANVQVTVTGTVLASTNGIIVYDVFGNKMESVIKKLPDGVSYTIEDYDDYKDVKVVFI